MLMIRGNTSNFIGHPLPKDSISDPQMGPPTMPGPRAPHHLNPVLPQHCAKTVAVSQNVFAVSKVKL